MNNRDDIDDGGPFPCEGAWEAAGAAHTAFADASGSWQDAWDEALEAEIEIDLCDDQLEEWMDIWREQMAEGKSDEEASRIASEQVDVTFFQALQCSNEFLEDRDAAWSDYEDALDEARDRESEYREALIELVQCIDPHAEVNIWTDGLMQPVGPVPTGGHEESSDTGRDSIDD